jgi:hypothetical protein
VIRYTTLKYMCLLSAILLLLACSPSPAAPPPSKPINVEESQPQPISPSIAAPTQTRQPAAVAGLPPTPASRQDSGGFDLRDPLVRLQTLQSYRQILRVAFTGQKGGLFIANETTFIREFSARSDAQMLSIQAGPGTYLDYARIGEVHYIQRAPDQPCATYWGAASMSGMHAFELATLLPRLSGAEYETDEILEGIPSQRYSFDAHALGYAEGWWAEGTVWIADPESFVVKYVLNLIGESGSFGEDVNGTQTWEYHLEEVDTLEETGFPQGCSPILAHIPTFPDAQGLVKLPEFLEYTTSHEPSQIAGYYLERSSSWGWTADRTALDGRIMTFTDAAGSLVHLSLFPDGSRTRVRFQMVP